MERVSPECIQLTDALTPHREGVFQLLRLYSNYLLDPDDTGILIHRAYHFGRSERCLASLRIPTAIQPILRVHEHEPQASLSWKGVPGPIGIRGGDCQMYIVGK